VFRIAQTGDGGADVDYAFLKNDIRSLAACFDLTAGVSCFVFFSGMCIYPTQKTT
jgi:hypothetical protein